jgi:hypothetical protein
MHKLDMDSIMKLHETQKNRIIEIEKLLAQSHAENYRLRSDYQRLGELLGGSISKKIY